MAAGSILLILRRGALLVFGMFAVIVAGLRLIRPMMSLSGSGLAVYYEGSVSTDGSIAGLKTTPSAPEGSKARAGVFWKSKQRATCAEAGYFASRCKGASAPAENSRPQPLPGRAACRSVRLLKEGRRRGSIRQCGTSYDRTRCA